MNVFEQILKDVEDFHGYIAGVDISFQKIKVVCRTAWEEENFF